MRSKVPDIRSKIRSFLGSTCSKYDRNLGSWICSNSEPSKVPRLALPGCSRAAPGTLPERAGDAPDRPWAPLGPPGSPRRFPGAVFDQNSIKIHSKFDQNSNEIRSKCDRNLIKFLRTKIRSGLDRHTINNQPKFGSKFDHKSIKIRPQIDCNSIIIRTIKFR